MLKRANILGLVTLVFLGAFISGSILMYQASKVSEYREAIGKQPFKLDLIYLFERITGNPDCVAVVDYVVLPTSIDMAKFTSEALDNCIYNDPTIPQKFQSVLIEVLDDNDKVIATAQTSNFVRYRLDTEIFRANVYDEGELTTRYVRVTGSPGLT